MPIVVQHAPDARLHLQFAEAAGQGQYRKWVAEYKQHQKDQQTQAFLSALGTGATIGLAGRQMKHQQSMQAKRIKAGQVKEQVEEGNWKSGREGFDKANPGWLPDAIQQAISGSTRGSALDTDASLAARADYIKQLQDHGTTFSDRKSAGSMARKYDELREQYIFGQRSGGMGGKSQKYRDEGRRERFMRSAPHVRSSAEDNMSAFIGDVANLVPADVQIFGRQGNRPAVMGRAKGQGYVDDESSPRAVLTGEQARELIRSRRESLNKGVTRDQGRYADEMMKYEWKDDVDQKDPRKTSQHRINEDGVPENRIIDKYHYGTAGEEHWQNVVLPQEQIVRTEKDKVRTEIVGTFNKFAAQFDPAKFKKPGESHADMIKRQPEFFYYGDLKVNRPKGGWQEGYFPGVAGPGMNPAAYGADGYDPNQMNVRIEREYDGSFRRVYTPEWLAAPTPHVGGSYNRGSQDLRYAHMRRIMRRRALAHGGKSTDAMAYEDLFSTGVSKPTKEDYQAYRENKQDNVLRDKGINPSKRMYWQQIDEPFEPEMFQHPAATGEDFEPEQFNADLPVVKGPDGEIFLADSPEGKKQIEVQKAKHYEVRDFLVKWAKDGKFRGDAKQVKHFYEEIVPKLNQLSGLDPNANPAGWAVRIPGDVGEKLGLRMDRRSVRGEDSSWTFMSPTWMDNSTDPPTPLGPGYDAFKKARGEKGKPKTPVKGAEGDEPDQGQASSADTSDKSYRITRLPGQSGGGKGGAYREQILRSFQGMPADTREYRNAHAVASWLQKNGDPNEYNDKNPNFFRSNEGKALLKKIRQLKKDIKNRPQATEDLRRQSEEYDEDKEGFGIGPKRSEAERARTIKTLDDLGKMGT